MQQAPVSLLSHSELEMIALAIGNRTRKHVVSWIKRAYYFQREQAGANIKVIATVTDQWYPFKAQVARHKRNEQR